MKYRAIFIILGLMALCASATLYFWLPQKETAQEPTSTEVITEETAAPAEPTVEAKETSFVFAGDMMYDRRVYHQFKNNLNNIFTNLELNIFKDADIRFANLEGPISSRPIADDDDTSLIFNFAPETINVLKYLSLNGVSLANNHTLNAGQSGFLNTQKVLAETEIKACGNYDSFDESNIVRYDTAIPVSIICVDYLAFSNLEKIGLAVKQEKDAGNFVIIFPHWGEEYQLNHVTSQERAAKSFIDAGADLVIGGHPHVVEDINSHNGKPIVYSLGNFVFDQTWSKDTQEGLIIKGKITEEYFELTFLPTKSEHIQPRLMNEDEKNIMLKRIIKINDNNIELIAGNTIRVLR